MKILGISYGTLNGGNDTMVKEALMGAQEVGAEIEFINANTLNIKHCTGCKACLQVGCPALSHRPNEKNGRTAAVIDPTQCVGCEVCAQACRFGAISKA